MHARRADGKFSMYLVVFIRQESAVTVALSGAKANIPYH